MGVTGAPVVDSKDGFIGFVDLADIICYTCDLFNTCHIQHIEDHTHTTSSQPMRHLHIDN